MRNVPNLMLRGPFPGIRSWFVGVLLTSLVIGCAPVAKKYARDANAETAVIILHGKGGTPSGHIAPLVRSLRAAGYQVEAPKTQWTRHVSYMQTYDEVLDELEEQVSELRQQGAERVVLAGHSLGANVALGYGAQRGDIEGVIVIGPGHTVSTRGFAKLMRDDVERAKAMIDAGEASERGTFSDINVGGTSSVAGTAEGYWSFFAQNGPASFHRNAENLPSGIPVLWIEDNKDWLEPLVCMMPKHPKHRVVSTGAGHLAVPRAARESVLQWLAFLDGEETTLMATTCSEWK